MLHSFTKPIYSTLLFIECAKHYEPPDIKKKWSMFLQVVFPYCCVTIMIFSFMSQQKCGYSLQVLFLYYT